MLTRSIALGLLSLSSVAHAKDRVSAIRFDAGNPEVVRVAGDRGLLANGARLAMTSADLVYTTNAWKTTRVAKLQYLQSGYQGFILPIAKGRKVEYAVHANVDNSYDDFRSFDLRSRFWANNDGRNYVGKTIDVTGVP